MRSRRETRRAQDDCLNAASFLRQDLVWSSDFDKIRIDLAFLLKYEGLNSNPDPVAVKIARAVLEDEYDIAVGSC